MNEKDGPLTFQIFYSIFLFLREVAMIESSYWFWKGIIQWGHALPLLPWLGGDSIAGTHYNRVTNRGILRLSGSPQKDTGHSNVDVESKPVNMCAFTAVLKDLCCSISQSLPMLWSVNRDHLNLSSTAYRIYPDQEKKHRKYPGRMHRDGK